MMRQASWPPAALLALTLWLASASPAPAQGIDMSSGGPVTVTARDGFEWRENEQTVIANGDARAVRGNVTVLADRLLARYRKKGTGPAGATTPAAKPAPAAPSVPGGDPETGSNEVYRLEADGHVRMLTPTDEAVGDHAVYDIDQAVLVMTGHALKLTTPQQVMTARDSMEYWSQTRMSVGRGNAVVLTTDGRRLAADVLVGFSAEDEAKPATAAATTAAIATTAAAKPAAADSLTSGKLKRIEAYGNVEVRTQVDTVRGDRGVYVKDTDTARVVGHVRITHGDNQINGPAADVNMTTGIAHIVSLPGQRVQGLIVPNSVQPDSGSTPSPRKTAP